MKLFLIAATLLGFMAPCQAQNAIWQNAWAEAPLLTGKTEGGMVQDVNGNLYLAGSVRDTYLTQYDKLWIKKYNPSGQVMWSKRWGSWTSTAPNTVVADRSGNIYIAGHFGGYYPTQQGPFNYRDTVDFDNHKLITQGADDIFLVKIDSTGSIKWVRQFGGKSTDGITALHLSSDGKLWMAGVVGDTTYFDTARVVPQYNGVFLARFDTTGKIEDIRSLRVGFISNISTDTSRNIYLAGSFDEYGWFGSTQIFSQNSPLVAGNPYIVKYDSGMNMKWVRTITGTTTRVNGSFGIVAAYINVLPNGDVLQSGSFDGCRILLPGGVVYPEGSGTQSFRAKYSAGGSLLWVRKSDCLVGVAAIGTNGDIYMAGRTYESSTIDSITLLETSPGVNSPAKTDMIIVKCDSTGKARWGIKAGGFLNDYANGFAFSPDGSKIYVSGITESPSVQFGNYTITNPGINNTFVAVLSAQAMGLTDLTPAAAPAFRLYPNPATGKVTLQLAQPVTGLVQVSDVTGRVLRRQALAAQSAANISLEGLAAGIYTVQLHAAGAVRTEKLVVAGN